VSSKIVVTLAKNLLGMGYTIYTDNWYSSPALFLELQQQKTNAVGTVRVGRKNMPIELKQKIAKDNITSMFTDNMMALKWHDKREVCMLSTYHDDSVKTIKTYKGDKIKPVVVFDYNKSMGAVDMADQMLTSYPAERKRNKIWYKNQFRHLLNKIVLNGYILHKKDNLNRAQTHVQFRIKLIERMIESFHKPLMSPKRGRHSLDEINPIRLTGRHFPQLIPETDKKKFPTKRCTVCCSHKTADNKQVRKETRYICIECDAPLCAVPCFGIYHTKKMY
jgi:hypothetical protein